ncbi:ankyrin repeat domain-containing protein [Wolbachia endosymbiont of Kradibia gibbosae]|uniref:ankyrin repeat domain-containing protein n=1 Tax=Wolbachia endosymbiont of Kradibia gibbosae TaxID=2742716 RepID=UPI0018D74759|nr:ankyrin repeat domain-containing protein [Wolbachia endosymbiont of Kradibia gibbosae]MBH5362196.1 ankyrin repeat domain-containing protein [Wolbachia endosymbiont of Kradibia gibbosae]MBH5362542.1 ankyrin repeat domain-containing protein [Wolbachia endosymbiont of Kradibia gibbosae]
MINNLDSIILGIKDGEKAIEDLRVVLKKRKEEVITTQTFNYALRCPKTTKEAIVHEILLHFIQNPGEQSLEQVIQCLDRAIQSGIYAKNNPIRNLDEEFRTHINFKDEEGNTLLHHAVIGNKTEEIITLLVTYSANPLIQNADNKIPLDLAQGETKEVLIKSMKKQANTKKESAMVGSLVPGVIIGGSLGVVLGAGVCVAVSLSGGMILGVMIASSLVASIAIGLAMYFLSQDYEQAKAIEKTISTVSSEISVDDTTAANKNNKEGPQLTYS